MKYDDYRDETDENGDPVYYIHEHEMGLSTFGDRMEGFQFIPTDSPPEEWNAFPMAIRKLLMSYGYSADGKAPKPKDPPPAKT